MHKRFFLLAGAALTLGATLAHAQSFPTGPVKVVVGYSAGGAVDVVARAVSQKLQAELGQPVIVDNRPGGGSNIAAKSVITSPADGYTLLMAANAVAANMALYQPAPYDVEKDLVPLVLIGRVPVVIGVSADSPYKTLAQLIAAAKAKPDDVPYATPGNGSTPHLAVELFASKAGINLMHVPYKGGSQALTDVIGGQVPVVALNALEVLPHVKSGKLRPLAVLSAKRSNLLPDVPTIAESGYPGFEASVWYGLMAPAGTPKPVLDKLGAAALKAAGSPEVKERLAAAGGEATPGNAAAFASFLHAERERYAKLITAAKIKPD
ncbi:tripartite tricarboxylate transporter substrate binding protein [Roseateles sp. SL47]|uniref:Bug family tripartite tricarboxylate transporter substrate binding protein n=1 Tax=Roseateles sp. SL47 TaxID=2995138 RepID=UPI00226E71EF|nr:tripartite tricarboxylate transporter substrate binding protein [Roseateles sp. SL47]WAC74141.1 tripartite tricarboxylate transporter substrate binding protein [Roseateles sp. SL47]